MAGLAKRALAVSLGVLLGVAIVAGTGAWHGAALRRDARPTPPDPVRHERAPDTRA